MNTLTTKQFEELSQHPERLLFRALLDDGQRIDPCEPVKGEPPFHHMNYYADLPAVRIETWLAGEYKGMLFRVGLIYQSKDSVGEERKLKIQTHIDTPTTSEILERWQTIAPLWLHVQDQVTCGFGQSGLRPRTRYEHSAVASDHWLVVMHLGLMHEMLVSEIQTSDRKKVRNLPPAVANRLGGLLRQKVNTRVRRHFA